MDVLSSKKQLMLGNLAIVRGALEAGVQFVTTYPGTPASEIGGTFYKIKDKSGVYFEYSTNEKVAVEAAAGAAFSGLKSLATMKHFGVNVASDSLLPLAYLHLKNFVLVFADDPGCYGSTQSEQDGRHFARMAHMTLLEPSDPQECLEFTKLAFQISEKYSTPVLIRLTTTTSHSVAAVQPSEYKANKTKGFFKKDPKRFYTFRPEILKIHEDVIKKEKVIQSAAFGVNKITRGEGKIGIIGSGASYPLVVDALDELNLNIPVLKLGLTYPVPVKAIHDFVKGLDKVLVAEELDSLVENDVKAVAKDANPKLIVHGKDLLPCAGPFSPDDLISALSKLTGKKASFDIEKHKKLFEKIKPTERIPTLCPGCPHRATFWAIKQAAPNAVYGGDIGCYFLGMHAPINMQDFLISMGAGMGVTHGINKATNQKSILFIGDSTFMHAGLPGLINISENKSNPLIVIMDNSVAAMTGQQPRPQMSIEKLVEACGIKHIKVVNAYNTKQVIAATKELLALNEPAVLISRGECRVLTINRALKEGKTLPVAQMSSGAKKCKDLQKIGCPAIEKDRINEDLCNGCALCMQVCPGAIKLKEASK